MCRTVDLEARIVKPIAAITLATINPKFRRHSECRHLFRQGANVWVNTLVDMRSNPLPPDEQGWMAILALPPKQFTPTLRALNWWVWLVVIKESHKTAWWLIPVKNRAFP
jgi:hypothetical protein